MAFKRYRPPRFHWLALAGATVVFGAAAGIVWIVAEAGWFYRSISVVFLLLCLLGFAELARSSVEVGEDGVKIAGLLGREEISFDEIRQVSRTKGSTALRLATGHWRPLPSWLGSSESFRRRVADRLKARQAETVAEVPGADTPPFSR